MPPERQPISDRSPDRVAGVRAQPSRRIDIMRSGLPDARIGGGTAKGSHQMEG
jgi:hypothetical protein